MKVESIREVFDHHLWVLAVLHNPEIHLLQVGVEVLVAPEALYQETGALQVFIVFITSEKSD